jgi:hypothetical protein
MRGMRAAGLCLLAVGVLFAVTASGAAAFENLPHFGKCAALAGGKYKNSGCTKLGKTAEEMKFEWTPLGEGLVKFTSAKEKETGNAVLESASGTEISCTEEKSKEGEYGPGDQVKNVVGEFAGCKALGSGCNSTGQPAEHINTLKLHGEPGIVIKEPKEEKNVAGSDLRGQEGEFLAEFSCGPAPVLVRGGVVVKAQNPGSTGTTGETTNKMLNKAKIAFVAEKPGKQVPSVWQPNGGGITHTGGPKPGTEEVLEGSVAGGAFEKSGQSLNTVQKTTPGTVKSELRMCEKTISCPN